MQVSFQFKFCRLMNRAKAEGRSGLLTLDQTHHICLLIRIILFPFSVSYACKQTFAVSLQRVFFVAILLLRSHFEGIQRPCIEPSLLPDWRANERVRRSARRTKIAHRAPKIWEHAGFSLREVQWRPNPGSTAFLITVAPVPCKYENAFLFTSFYTLAITTILWEIVWNHMLFVKACCFCGKTAQ